MEAVIMVGNVGNVGNNVRSKLIPRAFSFISLTFTDEIHDGMNLELYYQ